MNHILQTSGIGLLSTMVLLAVTAYGQEFRIETVVFSGDAEEPLAKTVTLFESGVVYDFLDSPQQVAVFRPAGGDKPGRFVLLDIERKVRTELATDKIQQLLNKLRKWSATQPDPMQQFFAAPEFSEQYDEATGTLTLTAETMTYRVQTVQGGEAPAMAAYREFCDWYARLNSVTQQGLLPFPRLKLNATLDTRGRVPTTVHLVLPERELDLRAEHAFTWRISRTDRQRIDEVRRQLREFKLVDNATFRK